MDRMIQGVVIHRTYGWPLIMLPGFISSIVSTLSLPLITAVVVEMD